MRVLTDTDVARDLTAEVAVAAARRAHADAAAGALSAPPRQRVDAGGHGFVLTAGGYADGPVGFRVHGTWPGDSDQAVLVWGGHGTLTGLVVGGELGARRTGALGGVAVDVLARPDARRVGVVGSGRQAWSQLWAIAAVRAVEAVAVHSPTAAHRERFAERARTELGLAAEDVPSAREAVAGADVVVLTTRSETPVVDAAWIEPGTHVSTVGPKTVSAHETPPELAAAAPIVAVLADALLRHG